MTCILLVDDDPDSVLPIALELVQLGHTVTMASSAPAGMSVVRQMAVQCVITDHEMPGVDGVEFCRMLRAQPLFAELPIVMMSAAPEPQTAHRGWSRFLRKPVALEEFLDVVDQLSAARLTVHCKPARWHCGAPRFQTLAPQKWSALRSTF